jgi:hypothetical protein
VSFAERWEINMKVKRILTMALMTAVALEMAKSLWKKRQTEAESTS